MLRKRFLCFTDDDTVVKVTNKPPPPPPSPSVILIKQYEVLKRFAEMVAEEECFKEFVEYDCKGDPNRVNCERCLVEAARNISDWVYANDIHNPII